MNKKLKSLKEHNKAKSVAEVVPVKNGIACPECGNELEDSSPNKTLMVNPPKKGVKCSCGYNGYRNANIKTDADGKQSYS